CLSHLCHLYCHHLYFNSSTHNPYPHSFPTRRSSDLAIKFTEMGRIELEAAIDSESDHIIRIRFAVKDTGIGISKEAQRRIFESFVQADGSVTRKYGGTGLGLSISTELISRMGGELRVDSAPGRGSMFWFILPFEKVHEIGIGESSQCMHPRYQQLAKSRES